MLMTKNNEKNILNFVLKKNLSKKTSNIYNKNEKYEHFSKENYYSNK